ncbi:MAG: peptide synthase [Acidobacteria bacterium]|nr:MAG: peptide synthase [Acidobacteriota bacterium]
MSLETSVNIASHLPAMARRQPDNLAVTLWSGESLTFKELDEASGTLARGLESVGIGRGVLTVLMVKPSLDFFTLTFALFKCGAVPVVVDPGMGIKNLGVCLAEAQPEAFIGIPKAHAARILFRWAKGTIRTNVTVGRRWFWGGYTLDAVSRRGQADVEYVLATTGPDETAAILFTSGSTGVPKGAVYTHGNFSAQVEMIRQTYGIKPGEIDMPTFPLFALFDPALGMAAVIPDMDASRPADVKPENIIEPILRHGVTNMFGSPALIDKVGRYGEAHGVKLPSLKRAITAGAPVPARVLERFSNMLSPDAQVFTPYGATESLPVCSIGSAEVLSETREKTEQGAGICVGRPVKGMTVAVIRISEEPIKEWSEALRVPRGEVGEIAVKGPVVTRSYLNRESETKLAKITVPGSADCYHRMGDLGYFDDEGRLWFCGRKSHRVVTSNETYYTIPCEGVFNAHPKVYRSALVGARHHSRVEPVLVVQLEAGVQESKDLRQELLSLGAAQPLTKKIQTLLFHKSLPVDIRHNSKIFREKLAVWATERLR